MPRKRQRREVEAMSLSFLDVISCGFGALILMLVLTKVFEPVLFEDTETLQGELVSLQTKAEELRDGIKDRNRDLIRAVDQDKVEHDRLNQLRRSLANLEARFAETRDQKTVSATIERELFQAKQSLSAEMQRLLKEYEKETDDTTVGGIPVDSEYVVFIIDTSGSMHDSGAWSLVLQKLDETLDVYPNIKGIQIMNDNGVYMFKSSRGEWMQDTPARRAAILDRLRNWRAVSPSNPVGGINEAISRYYRPGIKMSLYVFGDELDGRSNIQRVVDRVDNINQPDAKGDRLVRIHAVAFPVMVSGNHGPPNSGIAFAKLMRILCERNGGTFVGLNAYRSVF